jgi:hypothetical protein
VPVHEPQRLCRAVADPAGVAFRAKRHAAVDLAYCMRNSSPAKWKDCEKKYEDAILNAKQEYQQCVALATTTYHWNLYVCCHGLGPDQFENY